MSLHFINQLCFDIFSSKVELDEGVCEPLTFNYLLQQVGVLALIVLGIELTAHSDAFVVGHQLKESSRKQRWHPAILSNVTFQCIP